MTTVHATVHTATVHGQRITVIRPDDDGPAYAFVDGIGHACSVVYLDHLLRMSRERGEVLDAAKALMGETK